MTYIQAYNKIIDAYFKDEIKPMKSQFCFCGTLSPDSKWRNCSTENVVYPYYPRQYFIMEEALFRELSKSGLTNFGDDLHKSYEEALFKGMCAALEVLKQIHKERGEDVDGDFTPFIKREKKDIKPLLETN